MVLVSTQSSNSRAVLDSLTAARFAGPKANVTNHGDYEEHWTAALTSTEANLDDKFPAKARPRGLLIHQKSFYDFILTTFGLEQSTNFEPTYQQNPQQNQMT